jgi:hypothetical protein
MGRDRLVKRALRERFVVTMTTGETFEGLLLDADDKTLQLTGAFALSGQSRVEVSGDVYLPRLGVAYLQRPTA